MCGKALEDRSFRLMSLPRPLAMNFFLKRRAVCFVIKPTRLMFKAWQTS